MTKSAYMLLGLTVFVAALAAVHPLEKSLDHRPALKSILRPVALRPRRRKPYDSGTRLAVSLAPEEVGRKQRPGFQGL